MSTPVSRRGFFTFLTRPIQRATEPPPARVAVIQGRHCLAYRSFCSTCVERCPVPGALIVTRGIPSVNSAVCTGCGVCREVCPAPVNAVLLLVGKKLRAES